MSQLIPFADFIKQTSCASVGSFQRAGSRADSAEFERMRSHILRLYDGLRVAHSYRTPNGVLFDCVPIDQQPGLRREGGGFHKLAALPDIPPLPRLNGQSSARRCGPLRAQERPDPEHVHVTRCECPDGTIPMRRSTLEEMTRFATVEHFLQRGKFRTMSGTGIYRHAIVEQNIVNFGAEATLNVWNPSTPDGTHSISQLWILGIAGSVTQTVEVGWTVDRLVSNTSGTNSTLFIFWNPGVGGSGGSYNLEGGAFTQVYHAVQFGADFPSYSQPGGPQAEWTVGYIRDPSNGNWVMYSWNGNAVQPIGYYLQSLYGGGPLASSGTVVQFGGEVKTASPSSMHSGQMGSGEFASAGPGRAAYQTQLAYCDNNQNLVWCDLFPPTPEAPSCYTVDLHALSPTAPPNFFFGGPSCD
jgi:hypothetical protein